MKMLSIFTVFILTMFVNSLKKSVIDCPTDAIGLDNCTNYCIFKYKGLKNFYNPLSKLCEKIRKCTPVEVYIESNNTCKPILAALNGDEEPNGDEEDEPTEEVNLISYFIF